MTETDDPRANACLLLAEVGNSHVSIASSIDREIISHERFGLDQIDQVVQAAQITWAALPEDRIRAIAVGGVVPDVLAEIRTRLAQELKESVLIVGEDLHRPLSLAVEAPETVGIDRVCAAAAAYDVMRRACVIASFGTAITIDCVNDEGAYMGGAILPGLDMQAKSLHQGTALLPEVGMDSPTQAFGGTTEEAIRTGVVCGVAGALREITERYATELHTWPDLIATGGNAELIREHTELIDRIVPDLSLRGIALAYHKHFSPFESES